MNTLTAYLPRMAAEWELDNPGARWCELDATCCFVDISGFTALSERLARRGRIGAEELTEVLNHVFGRMLGIAYGKGGSRAAVSSLTTMSPASAPCSMRVVVLAAGPPTRNS